MEENKYKDVDEILSKLRCERYVKKEGITYSKEGSYTIHVNILEDINEVLYVDTSGVVVRPKGWKVDNENLIKSLQQIVEIELRYEELVKNGE